MATACAENEKKNIGVNRCKTMPDLPKCMITTPAGFDVAEADLLSPVFWQAALLANKQLRCYLFPLFKGFENVSSEPGYEDTPLSYEPVSDGQYRFKFSISDGLCTHKAMYTHRGSGDRVFIIDIKNNVTCTKKANGKYAGFTIGTFNTEKFVFGDGASVATKSPVLVALADNNELDRDGYIFPGGFLLQLERLTDVDLNIIPISVTTTEMKLTVNNACDGTEVLGLVSADFILTDETGAEVPVVSSYANGVYTLTGDIVDGVLTLRAPALLTVKAYEGIPAPVDVG